MSLASPGVALSDRNGGVSIYLLRRWHGGLKSEMHHPAIPTLAYEDIVRDNVLLL